MSIAEGLLKLYPTADPTRDYTVVDDGTGPRIAVWDEARLGVQPSQASIEAASVAAQAAQKADNDAFAQAVALLKGSYATMTPVQKALCVVLRRVVREMKEDA